MSTSAVEDYLKNIYKLGLEEPVVTTTMIARKMNFAAASVTGMLKKMSKLKFINYEPYKGVTLTSSGQKRALKTLRSHRLIELFLVKTLGISWDKVHSEAEKWEHVISDEIEDKIDEYLCHPKFDPHGAPIPSRNGKISSVKKEKLNLLQVDDKARVLQIVDENSELLNYLGKMGLYPGVEILIIDVDHLAEIIKLEINKKEHILGFKLASKIFVSKY